MTSAGFRYDILSNLSGARKGEKKEGGSWNPLLRWFFIDKAAMRPPTLPRLRLKSLNDRLGS